MKRAASESEQWSRLLDVATDAPAVDVCAAFERLAIALVPDLDGWPFYALPTSSLPQSFTFPHFGGYHHSHFYYWCRAHLPVDRGYGPTVIVKDVYSDNEKLFIAQCVQAACAVKGDRISMDEATAYASEAAPRRTIDNVCTILVHELAHAVDGIAAGVFTEWLETFGDVIERPKISAAISRKGVDFFTAVNAMEKAPPPNVEGHGARFVRILIHLDRRLSDVAGLQMARPLNAEYYGHAPYAACVRSLGSEPAKCINDKFADILSKPLPPAFVSCLAT